MSRHKPVVGLAFTTRTADGTATVRGLMRYANAHRKWLLLDDFLGEIQSIDEWPKCDGMITGANRPEELRQYCKRATHVISCSGGADPRRVPVMSMDDLAAGRLAGEHLIDCRLEHFAFYCIRGPHYLLAARRLGGFREVLAKGGFSPIAFDHELPPPPFGPRWTVHPHWPALVAWLESLPKPVGILCNDDTDARELAAVCLHAQIPVPDAVALLGVNNDELLCQCAFPPLSSVEMNFEQVGYQAARLLDSLLGGAELPAERRATRVPPLGVVRRASTDLLAIGDPNLAAALRFIRSHACDPCSVDDVARHAAVARRWLERHFVQKLGRSPHDEIIHVRMETARRLLLQLELTLTEVASGCGFSTVEAFHRAFRDVTGETPGAWRRAHRRGAE